MDCVQHLNKQGSDVQTSMAWIAFEQTVCHPRLTPDNGWITLHPGQPSACFRALECLARGLGYGGKGPAHRLLQGQLLMSPGSLLRLVLTCGGLKVRSSIVALGDEDVVIPAVGLGLVQWNWIAHEHLLDFTKAFESRLEGLLLLRWVWVFGEG